MRRVGGISVVAPLNFRVVNSSPRARLYRSLLILIAVIELMALAMRVVTVVCLRLAKVEVISGSTLSWKTSRKSLRN